MSPWSRAGTDLDTALLPFHRCVYLVEVEAGIVLGCDPGLTRQWYRHGNDWSDWFSTHSVVRMASGQLAEHAEASRADSETCRGSGHYKAAGHPNERQTSRTDAQAGRSHAQAAGYPEPLTPLRPADG